MISTKKTAHKKWLLSLIMLLSLLTFSGYASPRMAGHKQTETEVGITKTISGKRTVSFRHAKFQQCFTSFLVAGSTGKFYLVTQHESLDRIKLLITSVIRSSFQQSDHGLKPRYAPRSADELITLPVTG